MIKWHSLLTFIIEGGHNQPYKSIDKSMDNKYTVSIDKVLFEWDESKNLINHRKHGVTFFEAQYAFYDAGRVIAEDLEHSHSEPRVYCFGKVDGEVMTVRFTYRHNRVRLIGAGYWRKGRKIYEQAHC